MMAIASIKCSVSLQDTVRYILEVREMKDENKRRIKERHPNGRERSAVARHEGGARGRVVRLGQILPKKTDRTLAQESSLFPQ